MKVINYFSAIIFLSLTTAVAACGQSANHATAPPVAKNLETAAPSPPADNGEIRETIEGKEFVLKNNAGACQLIFGDRAIDLKISWQCDFHRSPEKTVRVYPRDFYSEKSKYPSKYRSTLIFLIEHSTAAPDNPKDCRTQLQAIKVAGDKITVQKTPSKLASCPSFQWEDINFTGVFE